MQFRSPTTMGREVEFGPYAVDRIRGVLTRDGALVPLRPKAWEVLMLLLDRSGELLSVDTILDSVWAGVAVTPKTLANVIGELRQALDDDAERPVFIETVHRRGYRFIGAARTAAAPVPTLAATMVGRDSELEQLKSLWQRARAGEPQVVFVVGEPGVGKTRLLQEFLQTIGPEHIRAGGGNNEAPLIATGQCIERHGAHEAYMPLLDAIANVASGLDANAIRSLLEHYAPTWLEQIPWLVPLTARASMEPAVVGFGAARMLREGIQFFCALAERRPVVLLLEDMHWADPESVDFVASFARRTQQARLLVVCTYRVAEARLHRHPLVKVADEACRDRAHRIPIENFSQTEIHTYLEQCFPDSDIPHDLTAVVEDHSGGNPLFVRATVDHLMGSGQLTLEAGRWRLARAMPRQKLDLPDTVRGVIDAQVGLLPTFDRELLEAAAVAGEDFTVDAVAAALGVTPEEVENSIDALMARTPFIRPTTAARPTDSTRRPRFAFAHALYQRVLYERIPAPQRRLQHQRIGEYLEGTHDTDIHPAVLADHFDRSRDHARAAFHLERCATAAARRLADRERLLYLERAFAHSEHLPQGSDRAALELRLHVGIGETVTALEGPQHERVAAATRRALAVCNEVDDPRSLYAALHGLWLYSTMRGDFITNQPLLERATALAKANPRPELVMLAEMQLGTAACFHGAPEVGLQHLEAAAALLAEVDDQWLPVTTPEVCVEIRSALAWNLWLVGRPDQALTQAEKSYERTIHRRDVVSTVVASVFLCNVRVLRGEFDESLLIARDLRSMGDEFDMDIARWTGLLLEAAVLVEQLRLDAAFSLVATSGIGESDPGLQQIVRTYFISRLALACGRVGNPQQGLLLLAEADARMARSGSPISEAEVWRIRGELAQQVESSVLADLKMLSPDAAEPQRFAEICLDRAVGIARRQGALSLTLRATTSLARLWHHQGRSADAYQALRRIYDRFSEGFETADLREAKELLEQMRPA